MTILGRLYASSLTTSVICDVPVPMNKTNIDSSVHYMEGKRKAMDPIRVTEYRTWI